MTEKRFLYDFEDCTGAKMVDFQEDKKYSLETIDDFRGIENLLNGLTDEKNQLQKDLDRCIEQISKLHLRVSDLAAELENKSKEFRENDFKLYTLEKFYTCPNCAFNSRELQYLKSLRKKE